MTLKIVLAGKYRYYYAAAGTIAFFMIRKGPENVSGNHTNNDKNSCQVIVMT